MLVSVIMPSFNSQSTIGDSVRSVLNQTYKNIELIVVDDNSTDDTIIVLNAAVRDDPRVHIVCLDLNKGAGFARNEGLRRANGVVVAFCDSDDLWSTNKLEVQIPLLEKYDIVCSSYDIIKKEKILGREIVSGDIGMNKMIINNYIGMSTALFRRRSDFNYHFSLIRRRQDWDFWLQLLENGHKAFAVNESLVSIRKGYSSLSSNKWLLIKANYMFYRLRYSVLKSISLLVLFMAIYLIRSINRYL